MRRDDVTYFDQSLVAALKKLRVEADQEMVGLVKSFMVKVSTMSDKTDFVKGVLKRSLNVWGKDPSGRW